MENLKQYTDIELINKINELKKKHDSLKTEIINYVSEIERIENIINEKIEILNNIESQYVLLVDELDKRNAV